MSHVSTEGSDGFGSAEVELDPGIVDCDVHPMLRHGLFDLLPFMSTPIRHRIDFMLSTPYGQARFGSPGNVLYMNPGGLLRRDAAPGGIIAGSEPDVVAEQLLDPFQMKRAILLLTDLLGLGVMPDPTLASEIARAANDWLVQNWLDVDEGAIGNTLM